MVGLLSGLFNVTVCVVFPIAIFLIILTRFNQIKKCKDRTESVSCGCMHIFSCTNTFPPTLSRLITKY